MEYKQKTLSTEINFIYISAMEKIKSYSPRPDRTRLEKFLRRYSFPLAAVIILFLILLDISFAGIPVRTVAHYKVSSMGLSIGDVATSQHMSDSGGVASVNFETKTTVKASFLWMGYQADTIEKGTLQKGELVSYSHKGHENGSSIDVEGRFENAAFRFDVREQGVLRSVIIPRNSYDYTTMECP